MTRIDLSQSPTLTDLYQLGFESKAWTPGTQASLAVQQSYADLLQCLEQSEQSLYGVHTHFGDNIKLSVPFEHWVDHQKALLRYLKVGLGETLPPQVVRRALRLQVYKLSQGFSGIHPETYQRLCTLADSKTLPSCPSLGSLGASGDLIPMAHALAGFFSEHAPQGPRDGLCLVNTNAMMASLSIELWQRLQTSFWQSCLGWVKASEALGWYDLAKRSYAYQRCRQLKPKQRALLEQLKAWQHPFKEGSPQNASPLPQERYSIRCAPMIFLDLVDNLDFAADKILQGALAVADNPILLDGKPWHGGLFYSSELQSAVEIMSLASLKLSDAMDRQALLLVTPELNHGLPANLKLDEQGDHLKGIHQLLSALLQKQRGLSLPASLLSFSCESNNQDIVPASMSALNLLQEALEVHEAMQRAWFFLIERAWRLRQQRCIPDRLRLDAWPDYQLPRGLEEGLDRFL